MSRFQPVNFKDVEDLLLFIPKNELLIVKHLREIILGLIPGCTEKLAYNVPFYYRNSRICFIWPASVPWGNVPMNGVQLGFCYGYLMNNALEWLEKGNRKQVYSKTFHNLKDIDSEMVKIHLAEALEVDKRLSKKK
ncbi:MAG: DUF1801 domain-containing protein [Bacteroidales bacterium]